MTYTEKIDQLKSIYGKGIELHINELILIYEKRNEPKEHITQFLERIKRKGAYDQCLNILRFIRDNECEVPFSLIPDDVFNPLFEMINKEGSNILLSDDGTTFYYKNNLDG